MALYKSIVAYDGTEFQGFQRQRAGLRTVQGLLENALRPLGWSGRSIAAAGRTDAGVHATGQVIAYSLEWGHEPGRLTAALNARLPKDVAVRHTEPAPGGFHPRFSARARRYRYRFLLAEVPDPIRERFAWRIWPEPDLQALDQAAARLIGRHDFGAFGRAPRAGEHTIRRLGQAEWRRQGDEFELLLLADAFLHRMVRRMVAAFLEVGWGRMGGAEMASLIESPTRIWPGRMAPPQGLCLESILYEDQIEWSRKGAEELLPEIG